MMHSRFSAAVEEAKRAFRTRSHLVHTEKWQALDISKRPEMATHEVFLHSFGVELYGEDLNTYVADIKPDLPWADDHFIERVSGEPLNPPPSEAWWPHAPQGNSQFKVGDIFSHSYPERYWPTQAGRDSIDPSVRGVNYGIRYRYGDLNDLVQLLAEEPLTRQAYLPVWFPEDTGVAHLERKPCTLGYHFIVRGRKLHCVYYIRSCDFVRHFRNDIYMTVRLQLWILGQLRKINLKWNLVEPGTFTMHITSLHMFRNDAHAMFPGIELPK